MSRTLSVGLTMIATISFSAFAANESPVFLGLARDSDGLVATMSIPQAERFCATHGGHLASAREMAYFAVANGAKMAEVTEGSPDLSFLKIDVINVKGETDQFFYNGNATYISPFRLDDFTPFLWTTSFSALTGNPIVFAPDDGLIGPWHLDDLCGALCVSN